MSNDIGNVICQIKAVWILLNDAIEQRDEMRRQKYTVRLFYLFGRLHTYRQIKVL